jgi:hypothetical protein
VTFGELLDAYEAGRVTRIAAMRWIGCRRFADFLTVLDVNLRAVPRGRLPLRPFCVAWSRGIQPARLRIGTNRG